MLQHLENVSRKVLQEHQEVIRDYVAGKSGIYALYGCNKLYYPGLASASVFGSGTPERSPFGELGSVQSVSYRR